jgi:segregation and condensation protein A
LGNSADTLETEAAGAEIPAAFAVVNGAPYRDLPQDLYIPPDALEVFLETFEGPLDLLLYLIRRQNLDILDIPIASITRQYVAYIDMMTHMQMELAAEYLLMAAILAEIKSRMLLPRPAAVEGEEEDPRADLVRRLREYERFRHAAEQLDALPRCGRDIFESGGLDVSHIPLQKRYPEVELSEVLKAFQDVLRRADRVTHHRIVREPLSVRERMTGVLERLSRAGSLLFQELFTHEEGRQGVVVSLLAILELSKERMIEVVQEEPFAGLSVRMLAVSGDQADAC